MVTIGPTGPTFEEILSRHGFKEEDLDKECSRFLGSLVGGTKVPRKFGMGVSRFLRYLVGDSLVTKGFQIS